MTRSGLPEQVQSATASEMRRLRSLAGQLLSQKGASKGGKARARALSSERRKEIGRMGGAASSVARRPSVAKIDPGVLKSIPDD